MAQVKPTNNKKKMSGPSLAALIVTIAILLGLVVSLLAGTGLFVRIRKGASSEHYKVNGAMMSYYANSYYQNWYSQYYYYIMFGMIDFDPQKPLDKQMTTDGKTTYYDYFVNGAKSTVTTYLKYCEAARVDPDVKYAELEAEAKEHAEESIKSLKAAAKENGMGLQAYIRQSLGQYVSVSDLKKAIVIENIASHYYEKVYDRTFDSITKDMEDEYFKAHLDEFITAEYIVLTLSDKITPEKVDEKLYADKGGKDSQEYKDAVAAAEAKAKELNEKAKEEDKAKLEELAKAKTLEEFKRTFLDIMYDSVFQSTYDTAVKNFAALDKPSDEDLAAYKAELKQKVIDAVIAGKTDIEKEEPKEEDKEPEAQADESTTETPKKSKWETAKATFPKSLITALEKSITDNTKKVTYTVETDLGKFLFGGVKAQYEIKDKDGKIEEGTSAELNDYFFEDKEYTAEADKNLGKYSMSHYFVTQVAQREDYMLRNVGHILFKYDSKATATDPKVSYKTLSEAKAAAEKLYEEIKASLTDGKITKEKFEEFAKVTNDASVFYDDVPKGKMSKAFEEWLYSDDRKEVGEIGLVETEHGWHIMYYGGVSEEAWRPSAHEGATNETMDAWFEALPYEVEINNSIFEKIFN